MSRRTEKAFERGRLVGMIEAFNYSLDALFKNPAKTREQLDGLQTLAAPIFIKRYQVMLEQSRELGRSVGKE